MNNTEWLAGLKAGDEVDCGQRVRRVAKVTATQVVIGSGHQEIRFGRNDGRQRGGRGYNRLFIRELTQKSRDAYERRDLAVWLKYLKHDELSLEQLRAVRAVLVPVEVQS